MELYYSKRTLSVFSTQQLIEGSLIPYIYRVTPGFPSPP